MPCYEVHTPQRRYTIVVERGGLAKLSEYIPPRAGKVFVVSTEDVWKLHGDIIQKGIGEFAHEVLFFRGGEARKKLAEVEVLAEQMVEKGADRSSVVIGFGGGILTDVAGFLAAIFMRGIPVIQVPTTLLAQVGTHRPAAVVRKARSGRHVEARAKDRRIQWANAPSSRHRSRIACNESILGCKDPLNSALSLHLTQNKIAQEAQSRKCRLNGPSSSYVSPPIQPSYVPQDAGMLISNFLLNILS